MAWLVSFHSLLSMTQIGLEDHKTVRVWNSIIEFSDICYAHNATGGHLNTVLLSPTIRNNMMDKWNWWETDINTTYFRSVISRDIMSHDRSNKNMTCIFCRKQNNKVRKFHCFTVHFVSLTFIYTNVCTCF